VLVRLTQAHGHDADPGDGIGAELMALAPEIE